MPIVHADRPPVATPAEVRTWDDARRSYEWLSRACDRRFVGRPARRLLDLLTSIPSLDAGHDLEAPNLAVKTVARLARRGVGAGLIEHLRATGAPLLSTFYTPAVIAADAGLPGVHCVVTDVDVHRVWVPRDPRASSVTYCVPAQRTVRRLVAYGVPADRIHLTGFPLPPELLGGRELPVARRVFAARLARLDPSGAVRRDEGAALVHLLGDAADVARDTPPAPLHVAFAVGGAGAQTRYAHALARGLAESVRAGHVRLTFVAGRRAEVAERLSDALARAGLSDLPPGRAQVLRAPEFTSYLDAFHRLLAETDVLWTKPSELTFFAALGLPLVFSPPLGSHERANRRHARRARAALRPGSPLRAGEFLRRALASGELARAALAGWRALPKRGTYRILDVAARG